MMRNDVFSPLNKEKFCSKYNFFNVIHLEADLFDKVFIKKKKSIWGKNTWVRLMQLQSIKQYGVVLFQNLVSSLHI